MLTKSVHRCVAVFGVPCGLLIALAIVGSPCLAQPCGILQDLGTPGKYSSATAVSADGSVVVGDANFADGKNHAFRWTLAEGMQDLGTLGGNSTHAYGVSADGSVVVGVILTSGSETHAFRWTASTGMQDLGTLGGDYSVATGASADGSVVVGAASAAGSSSEHAFRWTAAGGMQDLGPWSWASAVTPDGTVIVGVFSPDSSGYPQHPFRWTAETGMQDFLGSGNVRMTATAVSHDGSVIVGRNADSPPPFTKAFRWTAWGGFQDLGSLGSPLPGVNSAFACSADGSVVVGASTTAQFHSHAYRWTASTGMLDLDTSDGNTSEAHGISADGSVIVGAAITSDGGPFHAVRWVGTSDFNHDGFVSGDDYDAFVDLYSAGNAAADFNRDGFVTSDDFDAFINSFYVGC